MRRIAVINQKGGVGKTTTVANLAAAVASVGRKVLIIDLDPQAHLSLHLGIELTDDQASAYDVLTSSTPIKEVAIKVGDHVTLVPADIDLAAAEAELVSIMGREMILREAVDVVEADHDIMLIDCPPSLGVLTINALAAADEVIIPLQAHFFALQGVSKLLDTVMLVRQRINPRLKVAGFALCMHEAATRLAVEVVADLQRFLEGVRGQPVPWADARIYETRIRRNIKLAESSSFGQTVFDYAPRSNGASDYAGLAEEVFGIDGIAMTALGKRELTAAPPQAPPPPAEHPQPAPPLPPAPDAGLRIASFAEPLQSSPQPPPAGPPTPLDDLQPEIEPLESEIDPGAPGSRKLDNRQSAIDNPQPPIDNRQSAIDAPRPSIDNRQSAIDNPQSPIPNPQADYATD